MKLSTKTCSMNQATCSGVKKISGILSLMLMAMPALAGPVTGYLSAISGESDNAAKTSQQPLRERQDEYQLSIGVDYENSLFAAGADYLASERHFAEESQEEDSYVEGKSSLYFGNEKTPADLLIKHSRRILLQEPEQLQITDNLDERDILSVMPTLRTEIGEVDTLALTGDYTQVRYMENDLRDSSRMGGQLQWMHELSPVDVVQVAAQQMQIEFDAQPDADYKYQNAFVAYSAKLRALAYSLQAGYNQSENDVQGEFDAPSYALAINYEQGAHEISVRVNQQITDSSLGDGNTNSVGSIPGSDGLAEIHQLERLQLESRWTTSWLCVRCSAYLMYRSMDDDYITIDEAATQTTAGIGFSYQFSKAAQLSLGSENSRRKFDRNIASNSYELSRIRISFNYDFSHHLRARLIAWREDREKDENLNGYTENYAGLGLSYHF